MNADVFFGLQVAVHGAEALAQAPRVRRERANPFEVLTDAEFKRHFRFSKNTVVDIVNMLEPDLVQDPRGEPLTPTQQVCAALCHFGGGHYQRKTGLGSGVSQSSSLQSTSHVLRRRTFPCSKTGNKKPVGSNRACT